MNFTFYSSIEVSVDDYGFQVQWKQNTADPHYMLYYLIIIFY